MKSGDRQQPAAAHEQRDKEPPRIDCAALFKGGNTVVLLHGGQEYVLRITRNGKLILNK